MILRGLAHYSAAFEPVGARYRSRSSEYVTARGSLAFAARFRDRSLSLAISLCEGRDSNHGQSKLFPDSNLSGDFHGSHVRSSRKMRGEGFEPTDPYGSGS